MPENKKKLKSVFLEKIKFKEDFWPFKWETEIEFNDWMKDIIKFYLESKEGFDSTKAEKVSERMKINVIVGENGSGKSTFFAYLFNEDINYNKKYISLSIIDTLMIPFSNKNYINVLRKKEEMFKNNLNKNVLSAVASKNIESYESWKKWLLPMNDFYLKAYELLNDENYKKHLLWFFRIKDTSKFSYLINITSSARSLLDFADALKFEWFEDFMNLGILVLDKLISKKEKYLNFLNKKLDINKTDKEELEFFIFATNYIFRDIKNFFVISLFELNSEKPIVDILEVDNKQISNKSSKFLNQKILEKVKKDEKYENFRNVFKNFLEKLSEFKNTFENDLKLDYPENHLFKELWDLIDSWNIEEILNYDFLYKLEDNSYDWINSHYGGIKYRHIETHEEKGYPFIFIKWISKDLIKLDKYNTFLENVNSKMLENIETTYIDKNDFYITSNFAKILGKNAIKYLNWYIKYYEVYEIMDIIYEEKNNIPNFLFTSLSSGQKAFSINLVNIISSIRKSLLKNENKNFLILIDEPDLHLHLDWQKQYIQKLIDVFRNLLKDIKDISLHFIIATHSPFLLSDVPAENVILLKKDWSYTKVIKWENLEWNNTKNTFGANFVDLIRNWFFFDNKNLMWSFAENVIWDIAQKRREEITIGKEIKNKKEIEKIEDKIWDSFLKDNLLYFKKKDAENWDRWDN